MSSVLALARGDISEAVRQGRAARLVDGEAVRFRQTLASALFTLGEAREAASVLPDLDRLTIGAERRGDDAAAVSQARPETMWTSEARATAMAKSLYRMGHTRRLLQLFGSRYRTLHEFERAWGCALPRIAPTLILAMRREGLSDHAAALLASTERRTREALRAGFWRPVALVAAASTLVLRGDNDRALAILQRSVDEGWRQQEGQGFSLADPVFDPIRRDPRFIAIERRLAYEVARERAELASAPPTS